MNRWAHALLHALPVSTLVIALFYYWFAVADRYFIFLYNHLGATAFDAVTRGRYWMTGLIASGMVLVGYTLASWIMGRIAGIRYRSYEPPEWWRVWLMCATPVTVGILFITTTFNQPTLPLELAIICALATLVSLALALLPGRLAAQKPNDLAWLALSSNGLVPGFLLLRAVELPGLGQMSHIPAYGLAIGGPLLGSVWLIILLCLYSRIRGQRLNVISIYISGLTLSFILLPMLHYWLFVPPDIRYITASGNFFATNLALQLATFIIVGLMALCLNHLSQRCFRYRASA